METEDRLSPAAQWLDRVKETMAVDIGRFADAQLTGRVIVARLFDIPEVAQAFHLRAHGKRPLPIDPATPEDCREIAEALDHIIAWLDDGFHDELVDELREIRAAVTAAA